MSNSQRQLTDHVSYTYDAQDRRVSETVDPDDGQTVSWIERAVCNGDGLGG